MLRSRITAAIVALTVVTSTALSDAGSADADVEPDEPPSITADALLDDVLGRFPAEPLDIHGEMVVRLRKGVEVAQVVFNMVVDWSAEPARCRYTVLDDEGHVQREVVLELRRGGRPELTVLSGGAVDLQSTIGVTDLTWADLSLSFLWWRGGRIVGTDSAKGRDCYLVDVPAPAWNADAGYSRVRLWIDQSLHMLLRADGYDAQGELARSLWVRSLKKTDGRWMIKDMEVQRYPEVQRTRLRIHSARPVGPQASCLGNDVAPRWGAGCYDMALRWDAGRTLSMGADIIARRESRGDVKAS